MTGKTFLTVERHNSTTDQWTVLFTDASWETRFAWKQTNVLLGESLATITWTIPPSTSSGDYRIQHFGYRKRIFTETISSYSGVSSTFSVKGSK
jgi:neutral ceramidase